MSLFVIVVLVPAFAFCVLALVHFQKEIFAASRNKPGAGKFIRLERREESFGEGREGWESDEEPWCEKRVLTQQSAACNDFPGRENGSPEVYQLESAYFGPFLIVPLRKQPDAPDKCDKAHRVDLKKRR